MPELLWLLPVGFALGAYGTLIGAGGGFLLVPLLLLLYPNDSPHTIATISLTVVFVNALSGSVAYARMRRIDYKSGLLFSTATVPGAILGALATDRMPRRSFDLLIGILMLAICAFLLRGPSESAAGDGGRWAMRRRLVEADGTVHAYAFNPVLGVGLSLGVGFLSSLLGIGGGIIHVPVMANLLHFPVHVATATSHFTLAIMTLTGSAVHALEGDFLGVLGRILPLAIGVAAGAQLGAWHARWVRGVWIIRALVVALAFVGVRLIVLGWQGG
ncbi:MAG TPA: sulfite exporter TauE/SafE family protein [Methylomirabilota bacterium]|nr:sulfite exporter TauE/SafE family protein [Methylomirabilota bacterium]